MLSAAGRKGSLRPRALRRMRRAKEKRPLYGFDSGRAAGAFAEKVQPAAPAEAPCKGVWPSAFCEAAGRALSEMGASFPQQPAANLQAAWHMARTGPVSVHAEKYPLETSPPAEAALVKGGLHKRRQTLGRKALRALCIGRGAQPITLISFHFP